MENVKAQTVARAPYGSESAPVKVDDNSDIIDPPLMLQCLEAGALDVVKSPLDKAGIMGLTVHAFRVYKTAKKDQEGFMAVAQRGRKASWVGVEEEGRPYAYLREAMVKKLLKGICEPQHIIEDYQHRELYVTPDRQKLIAEAVGTWGFDGHLFSEDELVYAGYYILNHAVLQPELEHWRVGECEYTDSIDYMLLTQIQQICFTSCKAAASHTIRLCSTTISDTLSMFYSRSSIFSSVSAHCLPIPSAANLPRNPRTNRL